MNNFFSTGGLPEINLANVNFRQKTLDFTNQVWKPDFTFRHVARRQIVLLGQIWLTASLWLQISRPAKQGERSLRLAWEDPLLVSPLSLPMLKQRPSQGPFGTSSLVVPVPLDHSVMLSWMGGVAFYSATMRMPYLYFSVLTLIWRQDRARTLRRSSIVSVPFGTELVRGLWFRLISDQR